MPTATWREEKAEYVVQTICRVLASKDVPEHVRGELSEVALWNALKLFADALEERLEFTSRWSPALVEQFRTTPEKCNELLENMSSPDFVLP